MATAGDSWTVGRLLAWTTEYLQRHGSSSPRLDAEVLLAHVRGCQRIGLYTAFNAEVSPAERESYKSLIRRRAQGEPVAYLVGHKEFYSLSFLVTRDVLIPRPETEFLVDAALDVARQHLANQVPVRVLDVGTGSGVLAVCIAKFLPQAQVTATDISEAALHVAQQNALRHQVQDQITWRHTDLVAGLENDEPFHIVVSNPPYVSQAEYEQLSVEIRQYEPYAALVAGPTGLEVIQRLWQDVPRVIAPHGWLLLEISPTLLNQIQTSLESSCQWRLERVLHDLAGYPRVIQLQSVCN
jgi:release factor glutamine methyltransferase